MIRAGLQIPRFHFPDVADDELFERVASIATTAESSGFDSIFVMDHFWQLPMLGAPQLPMFECYTLLSALAARTKTARLGALVTGVTYRNPALLAKEVTSLDVISRGRAILGIGAAWFEQEHEGLGFEFPPVGERFKRLQDALEICTKMFREDAPSYEGTVHSIKGAFNSPRPIQENGPPIMIGGQGETKTLPLAARYADALNLTSPFEEIPRKLEVFARACEKIGRDPATVNKTPLGSLVIAPTDDEAREKLRALVRQAGGDPDNEQIMQLMAARIVTGGPETVTSRVKEILALGLDGVIFNLPFDAHDLDVVKLAGSAITAAFST